MRTAVITTRQFRAAAACAAGMSQAQAGRRFGVTQQAISQRIMRLLRKLTPQQLKRYQRICRSRYGRALTRDGRRIRIKPIVVSFQ